MIAVMAAFAEGTTIIRDAAELKVKETDRIKTTTEGLLAMGVDVTPTDDGMIIVAVIRFMEDRSTVIWITGSQWPFPSQPLPPREILKSRMVSV